MPSPPSHVDTFPIIPRLPSSPALHLIFLVASRCFVTGASVPRAPSTSTLSGSLNTYPFHTFLDDFESIFQALFDERNDISYYITKTLCTCCSYLMGGQYNYHTIEFVLSNSLECIDRENAESSGRRMRNSSQVHVPTVSVRPSNEITLALLTVGTYLMVPREVQSRAGSSKSKIL